MSSTSICNARILFSVICFVVCTRTQMSDHAFYDFLCFLILSCVFSDMRETSDGQAFMSPCMVEVSSSIMYVPCILYFVQNNGILSQWAFLYIFATYRIVSNAIIIVHDNYVIRYIRRQLNPWNFTRYAEKSYQHEQCQMILDIALNGKCYEISQLE